MWHEAESQQHDDRRHLSLPRILALHGGGTSARIFRAQCRVLETTLKPHFRFCYAQAPFLSQAGPDVHKVYNEFGPFRAWLRWSPDSIGDEECVTEEILSAIDLAVQEDNAAGATGEFVAVLGFSQGAKIAASILKAVQTCRRMLEPQWQIFRSLAFGVLMAGRGPLVEFPTTFSGSSRNGKVSTRLEIPTIHVHGLNDPNIVLHRRLLDDYCSEGTTTKIEWLGGHRVALTTTTVSIIAQAMLTTFKQNRTSF